MQTFAHFLLIFLISILLGNDFHRIIDENIKEQDRQKMETMLLQREQQPANVPCCSWQQNLDFLKWNPVVNRPKMHYSSKVNSHRRFE